MSSPYDNPMVGRVFSRWTVLEFSHVDIKRNKCWLCRCECGTVRSVIGANLRNGNSASCGCFQREEAKRHATIHGKYDLPEHQSWIAMIQRCCNENNHHYKNYGGRGIKVCDRWRQSFENFFEDMGKRPSKDSSIDRIDNNGNYEPGNCRWATAKDQARNTRFNKLLSFDGQTKTVAEWSEVTGISCYTLYDRIRRGWNNEDVLNKRPVK